MERRALGHGIAGVVGIAVTLATVVSPTTPAWASGKKSGGSHSTSAMCTAAKHQTSSVSQQESAITKAMEAGNWSAVQKDLLATFNTELTAERRALGLLSSAPSNVRAAESTVFKLATTEESIIKTSTSLAQFESSLATAAENPKLVSAEQTLAAYFGTKCGTTTPTT
jgi:hypothetical protein